MCRRCFNLAHVVVIKGRAVGKSTELGSEAIKAREEQLGKLSLRKLLCETEPIMTREPETTGDDDVSSARAGSGRQDHA